MNVLDFRPVEAPQPSPKEAPEPPPRVDPRGYSGLATALSAPKSEGPYLPPMTHQLSNTPIERIQHMFVYVVIRGLVEKDSNWVNDPAFLLCCELAGLQGNTPEKIRALYNAGGINMQQLRYAMVGLGSSDEKAMGWN